MPINNETLNKKLYLMLKTHGFSPESKDSTGKATPVPDDADVFKFTFKDDDSTYEPSWVTIEGGNTLKVYYDDHLMENNNFVNFLKILKKWSQKRQLGFELENQDHLVNDMAQRDYMKKKEKISEGYYPMGSRASYNDTVPTIKIVLQHTRQIQEGEQRFRNIAKIFLENQHGERILAPTNKPGIAQVYARHLAEGGLPNDERWNHIKSLCEEYSKMAGFVRAVRGKQFNESAQPLVEAGLNHYVSIRETLGKMRGHRGYNSYFESWTPTLMETEGEDSNINELFVQETLDPRIESVMPILSRLKVNLGEMKEVNELGEWAGNLIDEATDLKSIPEENISEDIDDDVNPVTDSILRRLIATKPEIFTRYGDEAVYRVASEIGDRVGNVEEIGSSDVSGWVKEVLNQLKSMKDIDEDISPEQKRVGQVGPTEKTKQIKGYIGKPNQPHPFQGRLVGASESVEQGMAEGLTKQARARKEAEAVKAAIERLEQQLKDPNPHIDKDDIRRRLETEKRRLELYRDVLDEQGVAEGREELNRIKKLLGN